MGKNDLRSSFYLSKVKPFRFLRQCALSTETLSSFLLLFFPSPEAFEGGKKDPTSLSGENLRKYELFSLSVTFLTETDNCEVNPWKDDKSFCSEHHMIHSTSWILKICISFGIPSYKPWHPKRLFYTEEKWKEEIERADRKTSGKNKEGNENLRKGEMKRWDGG